MLLGFCLIFCQFQPGVTYESVTYKISVLNLWKIVIRNSTDILISIKSRILFFSLLFFYGVFLEINLVVNQKQLYKHYIITYHISLVNVQTNYCNNKLLILDVKQLNKIMKLYYFHTLKALRDGQGKSKMYYGMSRVKKQLSGKRSIAEFWI